MFLYKWSRFRQSCENVWFTCRIASLLLSRAQLLCRGFCADCLLVALWFSMLCNIFRLLAKFNSSMLTQALNKTGWRALNRHDPQLALIPQQPLGLSRHLLSRILTGQVNHNTGKHILLIVVIMIKWQQGWHQDEWVFQEQGSFLEFSGLVVKIEVCTCRHRQSLIIKWPL